jgi:hypothetical protein
MQCLLALRKSWLSFLHYTPKSIDTGRMKENGLLQAPISNAGFTIAKTVAEPTK